MPCDLTYGGRRHSGLVLDISPTGLFLQTSAKLKAGDQVDLELRLPDERDVIPVAAEVVRRKVVPPRLLAVAHGGVGLRIRSAPEAYFRYLARVAPEKLEGFELPPHVRMLGGQGQSEGAEDAAPAEAQTAFRVRVRQTVGSRSRTVLVVCGSEEDAERRALAELGDGWKVLGIDPA